MIISFQTNLPDMYKIWESCCIHSVDLYFKEKKFEEKKTKIVLVLVFV